MKYLFTLFFLALSIHPGYALPCRDVFQKQSSEAAKTVLALVRHGQSEWN